MESTLYVDGLDTAQLDMSHSAWTVESL